MRTTRKVQCLVLSNFVLLVTKFLFLEENWALGYNCTIFRFSQVFLIYNIQYNDNNNNNNNNNILRDSCHAMFVTDNGAPFRLWLK